VRLTQEAYDVIRALAFVDDTTEAEIVRGVMDAFVDTHKSDSEVRDAQQLLARRRARREGKLTDIPKSRRTN
jgi:hypothetical protein